MLLALFVLASWAVPCGVASLLHRGGRHDLGVLLGGSSKLALLLSGVLVVATIVLPSAKPADMFPMPGIGSIAIGFASAGILQNWLFGLLFPYRQPFHTRDQISSSPFEGTVEADGHRGRHREGWPVAASAP